MKKRKTFRPRETYRIKWESLADKEVRTAFADNIASKFKELPTSSEDIETPWWNQEVKEAVRAKKVACKAWLANKSSLELRSQYSEARKAAATKVKLSKERAWKEFGERLDDDFKTANSSGKPFAVCVEKDLDPLSLSKIQMV